MPSERTARAAFAAVLAAGLWAGLHGPASAQPSGQFPGQPPAGEAGRPGEAAPGKAAGDGTQKPTEDSAQKPPDDTAQKPAEERAQKPMLVSILGRDVTNREGDGGRVIDVLVDHEGRRSAVVVEFGGFMGIGSRKVAVDWNALRFVRESNRTALVVDIGREQIRAAAEYKAGEPPSVLGAR